MSRLGLFLAVMGGTNLSAGLHTIGQALNENSASRAISGCATIAIGIVAITIAAVERRRMAKRLDKQ